MDICDPCPDIYSSTILSMIKTNRVHNTLIFWICEFSCLGGQNWDNFKGFWGHYWRIMYVLRVKSPHHLPRVQVQYTTDVPLSESPSTSTMNTSGIIHHQNPNLCLCRFQNSNLNSRVVMDTKRSEYTSVVSGQWSVSMHQIRMWGCCIRLTYTTTGYVNFHVVLYLHTTVSFCQSTHTLLLCPTFEWPQSQ